MWYIMIGLFDKVMVMNELYIYLRIIFKFFAFENTWKPFVDYRLLKLSEINIL